MQNSKPNSPADSLDTWVLDFARQVSPVALSIQSPSQTQTSEADEPPRIDTEAQLADYVWNTFGVRVPNAKVCAGHQTPWGTFCDIYFGRQSMTIVKGSRGLAGKTFLSALLGLTFALTYRADVTILGGSGAQSKRLHKAMHRLWSAPNAPRRYLKSDPGAMETKFVWGNAIEALTASQTSIRGPHPQLLLLDEIDEMDLDIFDAAMGQTMRGNGVEGRTGAFSTHQYDDGTMSEVLKRAAAEPWRNWQVREWCYKETLEPHGWLAVSEVQRKRAEMTKIMWETEVELQEPSPEGRAISTEKVERMFYGESLTWGDIDGQPYREFEPPIDGARYATGADWARTKDFVVIITLRCDVFPYRLVAYQRFRKRPAPMMIAQFEKQTRRYPGASAHDQTSMGGWLMHDFIEAADVTGVQMQGAVRRNLFTDYIVGIEHEEIIAPRIEMLYKEHRNVRNDDLWKPSGHAPDGFVGGAMAYKAANRPALRVASGIEETPKGSPLSKALRFGAGT